MASDPFFVSPKSKKRKATSFETTLKNGKRIMDKLAENSDEEEKTYSDDIGPGGIDDLDLEKSDESEEELEINETPAEKRRRLAKKYIETIEKELDDAGFDAADIDRDLIAERLRKDALEQTGRAHRIIADTFSFPIDYSAIKSGRLELSATCAAIMESGQFFYIGSKDHSISKWDVKTGKKLHVFPGGRKEIKKYDGHTNHVLALAVSSDGNYMASGGVDKNINIWSVKEDKLLKCFTQHKDSITGLVFRKGHNQLYSCSLDRTIKLWNIDDMGYIETLFGHQDQIMSIDILSRERCVTVGARDRTCRLWKIVEESQLIFHGSTKEATTDDGQNFKEGSLDVVAMIDEENFLSGGDSGSICLWNTNVKKPVFVKQLSHGLQDFESESEGSIKSPCWITALATVRFSDLFASGSWDGNIRLWKLTENMRSFTLLTEISMIGFVNTLQFMTSMDNKTYLLAGIGQEHKLGRWKRIKKARNGWRLIELASKV
ncbi:3418_t:CDS:2 [Acaulospora morrowiae]|uniref:3418_t:CDS:1 n=1 Tax=Acaulospora morrowiae TaxID=94023 RepID=A0A9N8W9W8_9GLOM|nr:3418_t:CDS:2 [Acaulospora morrowiae]